MKQQATQRIDIPYDVRLPITHKGRTYMCYFGEWLFVVDYRIEKENIEYSLFSASFTKSDLFSEDITPQNIFLKPSDIDELILHKITIVNSDYFFSQSDDKEDKILAEISAQNGSKSILELMEDMRLNADNIWESLSA